MHEQIVTRLARSTLALLGAISTASGIIANVFGAVAAILSAVWAGYRLYDYLKKRKAQQ
jgi:uncharacterized membrane-anchored protein